MNTDILFGAKKFLSLRRRERMELASTPLRKVLGDLKAGNVRVVNTVENSNTVEELRQ